MTYRQHVAAGYDLARGSRMLAARLRGGRTTAALRPTDPRRRVTDSIGSTAGARVLSASSAEPNRQAA